jgi:hypothetical protein
VIRQTRRLAAILTSVAAVCMLAAAPGEAAQEPRQQLVHAYSPVVMQRAQEDPPCDDAEEQYAPTTVHAVLGNPDVRLIPPPGADSRRPAKTAPTASDIAGLGGGYHLDLPGDPLEAGCTYATDFAALEKAGKAPAITYAHIRRQPGESALVVQYWFYWYFNQFNDLHESDWEGMQIVFDAISPGEALARGPAEIGLFQHGGGEKADWSDGKVEKRGTHPVVYPGAGSHATFYESAVYIENGQRGSGVGCDNTSEPLREVRPRPVLVPTHPAQGSRFQWLTYRGRWGQEEESYNNGPTGPNTKPQWLKPLEMMSELRSSSPKLPSGALLGPAVTSAFCGAVAEVSGFINLKAQTPAGAILLVLIAILIVAVPAALTRWRPVSLMPLRQPRAFGQLIRAARQLYGRHWRTLVVIGLTSVPIVGALAGLHWALEAIVGDLGGPIGSVSIRIGSEGSIAPLASMIGSAVVAGAVIAFVRELERGRAIGWIAAYRQLAPCFWRVAFAQLLATLLVVLIALTVIGIPIAIWKYVEWQFVQQEVLFGDKRIRDAFRGSAQLVRGRWWYTVRIAGFLWLLSVVAGPVLGFALIFADLSLTAINLLGSLVFALLLPYVAVGRTLLYFDLTVRAQEAPEVPKHRSRWLPRRRPSPATPA